MTEKVEVDREDFQYIMNAVAQVMMNTSISERLPENSEYRRLFRIFGKHHDDMDSMEDVEDMSNVSNT